MVHLQVAPKNELIARAIEYLKYLNGLEIVAGMNFQIARDNLDALHRIDAELYDRLTLAFQQEIQHAAMVREMLSILGFSRKKELTQVMFWLQRILTQSLTDFPSEHRPYLQILLNLTIEERMASSGNLETWECLQVVADEMEPFVGGLLYVAAERFHQAVAFEEAEHVKLDYDLVRVYSEIFPQVDRDGAMRALRSRGTPFRRAIRVKREFVKAAMAVSNS
jgi:hypothetical protein